MKSNKKGKNKFFGLILFIVLSLWFLKVKAPKIIETGKSRLHTPSDELFVAPGKDWQSEAKVEDYFVERLGITEQEAKEAREKSKDGTVMLRLREDATLDGLTGNLYYYGFIRDKNALKYALEFTEDTHEGRTPGQNIEIGENTISLYSYYRISENMNAWEIADVLLNDPTYFAYDEYNKLFLP